MTTNFTREQFLEKPLPSSPESERVILGAILLDNTLISQAIELLKQEDFYSPLHRRVYKAMTKLFERGAKIDPILIGEELNKEGQLENIGRIATITNLTYGLPHFSDIETYAKIVTDKAFSRNLIRVCSEITSIALEEIEPADTLAEISEQKIFNLCQKESISTFETIFDLSQKAYNNFIDRIDSGVKTTGLRTGFADLDSKLGGLHKSDLVIVAARPSMGKTALCLNIAQNAATLENAYVAVFSLEMSKEQLALRILASEGKIDAHRFRNGYFSQDDRRKIEAELKKLYDNKIYIDDTPGISPLEMRAKLRRLIAEQKQLDLIVVDYMQLMSGSGKRNENRQQEVSQISRELKGLAKELNVPLIALSQLSRAPEARNPPKPLMSDLRESGSIEQDADVVAFIYREEYYKQTEENSGVAEIIISKQRHGPTGSVKLAFLKEFTRFEDYYEENKYPANYYEKD